jgi:hypothetical protein
LTLGYPPSHDPKELVAHAESNRLEQPSGRPSALPLMIHAADYNSEPLVDRRIELSTKALSREPVH